MLNNFYLLTLRFPKLTLLILAAATALALSQLGNLRWETDARVYFPKGHPAITYDEHVADTFGVKDSIIIGIVNEGGIFNAESLARVERITQKVADLPGVLIQRRLDVASLSSASVFVGNDTEILNDRLMETVPQDEVSLAALKTKVYDNADLFVGNLVSADGKATMIRAKLKEGIEHRYSSYFQIKGILAAELGSGDDASEWWSGNSEKWQDSEDKKEGAQSDDKDWQSGSEDWDSASSWPKVISDMSADNGDRFYIAGRPVIEVSSGLNALEDLKLMVPLLLFAIAVTLFLMFRSMRGVLLPMLVVCLAIIWTLGVMAAFGVPMYTISTMLPVILVAVGIGDGIHLMSHYEDIVFDDPHRDRRHIVMRLMSELGLPLMITTLTTAVGFLSLWWAEMPPFRLFGIYTALGVVFCWLASVTMVPAVLSLIEPHVSGYLKRRRSMRLHDEAGTLVRLLVAGARAMVERRTLATVALLTLIAIIGFGARDVFVDSSWIADFREESEVVQANDMLNEKFDGTIFLSVVVDGKKNDAMKSPELLRKIEALQNYVDGLEDVGGSLSLVDYVKSVNKTFHSGDEAYDVLPATTAEIGQYLYLLTLSGRPEQLDTVVDYGYRQANITITIKTDHTQQLKQIIDSVNGFVATEFKGLDVDVNLAGSANNSYVWADLLIDSQAKAIVLSKLGIFLMAAFLFRSFLAGFLTVIPVIATTLIVAGMVGWLAIPLDVSTVLAAGVAIGVGVDYAVHYIFRYSRECKQGMAQAEASLKAVRTVGKAIVLNATVVTIGFLVLGLSQFPPHVKLGYFVSVYMVVACLAALLLLPLAFAWLKPRPQSIPAT